MNQNDDLLEGLDIPGWTPRASRNQKLRRRTKEVEQVPPFVRESDTQKESQTQSSKSTLIQSWGASAITTLRLVVAIMMVAFTLAVVTLIIVAWPLLSASISNVHPNYGCNQMSIVKTDCPYVVPSNK